MRDSVSEGLQAAGTDAGGGAGRKVIVLTGQNGQANALKAVAMGA